MIDVTPAQMATIQRILAEQVPDCEVRAFGSRVTWTAKDYSDLDLAVVGPSKLESKRLGKLKEAFEESDLPFRVDVIDWHGIAKSFRKVIEGRSEPIQHADASVSEESFAAGWKMMTLGEVLTLQRGFDLPSQDRKEGRVPIVSSSGVSGLHSEAKVKAPGVVTGRYGTIGQVFFITEDFWPLNTTLYVKDFKGNDPHFISYLLKRVAFDSYQDKGAVPGINRNHVHQAKVLLPPLVQQRTIAHILGTLDDKIELNRRQNETLEAMARALFKSWFVDFDPVRAKAEGRDTGLPRRIADLFPDVFEDSEIGEIPKGYKIPGLDGIATYLNGLAMQRFPQDGDEYLPVIKIAQLRQGSTEGADRASSNLDPAYVVSDGDILFSWSGSLEVEIWCGGKGALNQHLFKVIPIQVPKWFAFLWTRHHLPDFRLTAAGKATTMGHIQRHHLTQAKALLAPPGLLTEMDKLISPLFDQMILNNLEARRLSQMRDVLLPQMLSGELQVGATERVVGAQT